MFFHCISTATAFVDTYYCIVLMFIHADKTFRSPKLSRNKYILSIPTHASKKKTFVQGLMQGELVMEATTASIFHSGSNSTCGHFPTPPPLSVSLLSQSVDLERVKCEYFYIFYKERNCTLKML